MRKSKGEAVKRGAQANRLPTRKAQKNLQIKIWKLRKLFYLCTPETGEQKRRKPGKRVII